MLVGLLLVMISQVVLALKRTGLPSIALVIDESASMGIDDRYQNEKVRKAVAQRAQQAGYDKLNRLNLAKTILQEQNDRILRKLARDYQLKLYFLSNTARPATGSLSELIQQIKQLEPSGQSTQLGRGLRTVLNDLRGTQPAAIILFSDGVTTEGESLSELAAYARRKAVPLYTVALGDDQPVRDVEVTDLLVDEVVFVDDIVQFEFNVTGHGYTDETIELVLREKDAAEPLARTTVKLVGNGEPRKARIPYRPTAVGEFEYTVEAVPRPDESNADNNRQTRLVSVRKEQIRLLLAQSYPSFEFRYLKNMLERDQTIELKTVLQEADPQYAAEDKSALTVFPYQREELLAYDVIIFGDVNPGFLSSSATAHVAEFVREKGGGLVLISGPLYMPQAFQGTALEPLVPVDLKSLVNRSPDESAETAFQLEPTELGLASSAMQLGDSLDQTAEIWRHLPPLYWYLGIDKLRPAARVLAEHPTELLENGHKRPLVVLAYAGAGKVLFHAIDETWRWRYQVGDVYFARYWIQAIRYLSRSKLLGKDRSAELTADRREYRRGEAVRLRLRFLDEGRAPAHDDGVAVVVQRDQREQRSVTLRRVAGSQGVFEGTLPQAGEGDYHAWVASPPLEGRAPACDFLVSAPAGEFERIQIDKAELERAARQTGGKSYTFLNAARLLGDLPAGRQVPIDSLPSIPLWNRWPVLAVFLALLIGEWIIRKRIGLL
jgi:hypothetical protein